MPQAQVAYAPAGAPYAPQTPLKKPLGRGVKAFIFVGGAVVLAVALILVFALSGGGGPLSGNTVQTKFVNENVGFFSKLTGDFQVADASKMLSGPFEYTVDVSAKVNGNHVDSKIAMAYDQKAFGVLSDDGYNTIKLLLIGDELRSEAYGGAQVIEFDTDADVDANMTLADRFFAMLNTGDANVDYKKLVEILVNSIPGDCFERSGDSFTMTLDSDALADTMNAFAEAIENEKEINEAFSDFTKDIVNMSLDLSEVAEMAADAIEGYGAYYDFELVWEIAYENGKPDSVAISYEDDSGYNDFTLEMGRRQVSGGNEIEVSLETAGGYSDFSLE
jgi:hypothetical protein